MHVSLDSSAIGRRDDHGLREMAVGAVIAYVCQTMSLRDAGHPIEDMPSIRFKSVSAPVQRFEVSIASLAKASNTKTLSSV